MDRLPANIKLDVNETFESQREAVNKHIIPVIKNSIDKKTFSVVDSIIQHIIYECHRYQRENFLNKKRSDEWNDSEKRRKHANSRRTEVSKKIEFLALYFINKMIFFIN